MGTGAFEAFDFHAREPTAVDSLPNLCAKAALNARPAFIGNLGHFSFP